MKDSTKNTTASRIVIAFLLGMACLISYVVYRTMRDGSLGQKQAHRQIVQRLLWGRVVGESQESGKLPLTIPEWVDGSSYAPGVLFETIDPFDLAKKTPDIRRRVRLYYDTGFQGGAEEVHLSLRCNPMKYVRLTDELGLIYSVGPDETDDLVRADRATLLKDLLDYRKNSAKLMGPAFFAEYQYNPTNGFISPGDAISILDLAPSTGGESK